MESSDEDEGLGFSDRESVDSGRTPGGTPEPKEPKEAEVPVPPMPISFGFGRPVGEDPYGILEGEVSD